jgi:hypothetical protein
MLFNDFKHRSFCGSVAKSVGKLGDDWRKGDCKTSTAGERELRLKTALPLVLICLREFVVFQALGDGAVKKR